VGSSHDYILLAVMLVLFPIFEVKVSIMIVSDVFRPREHAADVEDGSLWSDAPLMVLGTGHLICQRVFPLRLVKDWALSA
jgi:hypothetical protein